MNWKTWWPFRRRSNLGQLHATAVQKSLFGAGSLPGIIPGSLPTTGPAAVGGNARGAGLPRSVQEDRPLRRPSQRSWVGWILGQNRRRDLSTGMVQSEFRLGPIKPIRNELREDDIAIIERRPSKLIWETPVTERARDDQDLAWNRLRERGRGHAMVMSESEP